MKKFISNIKTKIYDNEQNYTCVVVKINNLYDIEGLNNLRGTKIHGHQILVDKNTQVNDVGLYFPTECVLSQEFLSKNNLYRHSELNHNKEVKGFFEDSGRVKAVKFLKQESAGFWIPIVAVSYITNPENLSEEVEFQDLNDFPVCRKFTRRGRNKIAGEPKVKTFKIVDLVDVRCYPEHVDSSQLLRNMHKLTLDDLVSFSIKLHGVSLRVGHALVYRQLNWFERLLKKISKVKIDEKSYRYVVGSRRVIKSIDFNGLEGKQHYYSEDIWTSAAKVFENKLHKGELIFSEIVGWINKQTQAQKGYSYSLPEGEHKVYVYRIARTNEDGVVQDLSWNLMKERCKELGVDSVPEVFYGTVRKFLENHKVEFDDGNWQDVLERLLKKDYLEKQSIFSSSNWSNVEEGLVLHRQQLGVFDYLKIKAFGFLNHESKMNDKGEADIEEDQQVSDDIEAS